MRGPCIQSRYAHKYSGNSCSADILARPCSYVTLRILGMSAEDKVCRDARAWVRSRRS